MSAEFRPVSSLSSFVPADSATVLTDEQERKLFSGQSALFLRRIQRLGMDALAAAHALTPSPASGEAVLRDCQQEAARDALARSTQTASTTAIQDAMTSQPVREKVAYGG